MAERGRLERHTQRHETLSRRSQLLAGSRSFGGGWRSRTPNLADSLVFKTSCPPSSATLQYGQQQATRYLCEILDDEMGNRIFIGAA